MQISTRSSLLVAGAVLGAAALAVALLVARSRPAFESATQPLIDWGKVAASTASQYYQAAPDSVDAAAAAVRRAAEDDLPIRVRGRGHSANGSSLPRGGELLLFTENLNHFEVLAPGVVRVGAGVTVFGIRSWLGGFGYTLPVFNTGTVGPSLGGYISAGGIGLGSAHHGGLWENVRWIGLIDGQGTYRRIDRGDPLFRWLFGSMGQLGLIVEAAIDIVPLPDTRPRALPPNGRVPEWWEGNEAARDGYARHYRRQRMYSVAVFAPVGSEDAVERELGALLAPFAAQFHINAPLRLPIRFRSFNPPLIFPAQASFTAVGYELFPREGTETRAVLAVEERFAAFVAERGYRRYLQMELAHDPARIAAYFGEAIWSGFAAAKAELDPHGRFGAGLIAPAPSR